MRYMNFRIALLVKETLSNKEKLIQNIALIKAASFHLTEKNAHLFFPLINDFCYVLGNLEGICLVKQRNEVDLENRQ